MIVLYRSKCKDGLVIQGKCEPFKKNKLNSPQPCKESSSCSNATVCVKGFCHELCNGRKDCIEVDGYNIVVESKCLQESGQKCAAYGDKYCHNSNTCKNRVSEGASCEDLTSLDECKGDRVQACYERLCTPICLSQKDCEPGKICDRSFSYIEKDYGICTVKPFPAWAIAVIVFLGPILLLAICVAIVKINHRRKKRKGRTASIQQNIFQPYSLTIDPPLLSPDYLRKSIDESRSSFQTAPDAGQLFISTDSPRQPSSHEQTSTNNITTNNTTYINAPSASRGLPDYSANTLENSEVPYYTECDSKNSEEH